MYDWWTQHTNWNCTEILPKIECPCMCIHGEKDIFFPEDHTRMICESLKNGGAVVRVLDMRRSARTAQLDEWLRITMDWLGNFMMGNY